MRRCSFGKAHPVGPKGRKARNDRQCSNGPVRLIRIEG